jgi:hypothetical protein
VIRNPAVREAIEFTLDAQQRISGVATKVVAPAK